MLKILVIVGLLLFFGARLLSSLGASLGVRSRKPFRQAKWIWSWFAGSEDESIQAEREYGRECAREFAAQFPGRPSRDNQALVDAVGSRLTAIVNDPRREFRFSVAASDTTNAFALPGGFVFITEPLLGMCGHDEAEIAFFLGHEMAHVLRGHTRDMLTANTLLKAVSARLPGSGTLLRQVIAKGYSRDLELEADREGARLMVVAGFDPGAAVRGLRHLEKASMDNMGIMEFFASHPPIAERVQSLEKRAKSNV